ncbi:hypothetical protein DWB68_08065 [Galactobacter valiniphilus]|uniref:DUF3566 domain-containing protein n=1 Tax=Galactobacter valiniphilus TaxID=2676122 RepID=A0A399J9U6_9MICC|nr:hypothetical protein DWB68_08065 [Galactobacter valiniphilus]
MSTPNTPGGRAPRPQQPRTATARPAQAPRSAQPTQGAPRQAQPGRTAQPVARPAAAGAKAAPVKGAPTKGAPARPGQRPAQQGLVRPAPKAKVRKARLLVSKVDVWSVLKLAFLLSVALGIITVVAAVLLWLVFDVAGVFNQINSLVATVLGSTTGTAFDVKSYLSMGQVTSFAVIIAVVNVVLLSALSMISAFIYNLASGLVGGVSVTLTDD